MGEIADLEDKLERLRAERESVESELSDLQTVVQFNENMLTNGGTPLLDDDSGGEKGDVTDQLVESGKVTCWTCGMNVDENRIQETLDRLRERRQYKVQENNDLETQIQNIVQERDSLQAQQRRRNSLEHDLDQTNSEIELEMKGYEVWWPR